MIWARSAGKIRYFEGDIRKVDPKAFGFFKVEIIAPSAIKHPIIQTKLNTGNGIRTVSTLGTWNDIIFSEEMDNAIKYGYKFNILNGYLFEKANIFKDYIDILYEIKENSNRNDPMYLISKLLLNSLYGRQSRGMDYRFDEHVIISEDELIKYVEKDYLINEVINLDNDKSFVSLSKDIESDESKLYNDSNYNISIGIASAVTAYSRIFMSKFKNSKDYNLYYTDTDSIYIDKPLDSKFIGSDLGQFKLENIFKYGIFLAPKVYGGLLPANIDINPPLEITKVKGFKNHVKFNQLKSLLNKNNSLKLEHEKWFRNIEEGNITVKNNCIRRFAPPTENKRKLIYKNNKLIGTKAFIINMGAKRRC